MQLTKVTMNVVGHFPTMPTERVIPHAVPCFHLWHWLHDVSLVESTQLPDVLLHIRTPVINLFVWNTMYGVFVVAYSQDSVARYGGSDL